MEVREGGGPPPPPSSSLERPTGISEAGAPVIGLLLGGLLATLLLASADGDEPIAMTLSMALQYCAPGILALAGWRGRPALYLAAGVVGSVVPFTAMSGLAMPFFIPAAMSFVAYGRRAGKAHGRLSDPAIAMLAFILLAGGLASMFVHQDPFCRTGPNFSECGSDIVTTLEASLSLAFSVASIVAPIVLATRPTKRHRDRSP